MFRGARCTDGATAACLQRQQRQQRSAGRLRCLSLVFSFVLSFFLGVVSVLPLERGCVIFSSMRKLQAIFSSYDASCKFLTIIRENEASLFHRHLLRIRWVSWCRLDIQHRGTRTRRRNEEQACMDADIQRPPDDTLPDLVVDLRRVFL